MTNTSVITASKSARLTVQLAEDYRLQSDGTQYIVQERHIVDPTLAPNWPARIAYAITNDMPAPDASLREDWRNCPAPYYSLSDAGLTSAINAVKHRSAITTLGYVTLTEFVTFMRDQSTEMIARVSGK
jgi:hypothetical protein